jgi:Xaa-Pro aminopeptidase
MTAYDERLARVRAGMKAHGLDTLILTPGASMRYLTGFSEIGHERLLALVVPKEEPWFFIAPSLNAAQVRENAAGIADVRIWDDAHGWESRLKDVIVDHTIDNGVIGIDDDMAARFSVKIQQLMPTTSLRLAGPAFASLRAAKDTLELASMQHAADATDALIPIAFAACQPGASELSVALALQQTMTEAGHEPSFTTIVAAGPNGALPHHHTGKTKIKHGDIMVLDFGAIVEGYCGDITRVAAVGEASDEARKVYDIVYRAHQAAIDAIQPGVTAEEVDAAARKVIVDAGYGEFFLHRTGHGIGLECHEAPNIVGGNKTVLQPGHCFSIEPGIYLPGQFGVRLENIVTVIEDGRARVFNQPIPPELPVV